MRSLILIILLLVPSLALAQPRVSFSFNQKEVSVTAAQNNWEKNLETQRFVLADVGPVFGGYVGINHDKSDVLGIGTLPLRISWNRFHLSGGGWIGTNRLPSFGTYTNFAARLQIDITGRIRLTWLHLSNAGIGDSNPASDACGLTWRFY